MIKGEGVYLLPVFLIHALVFSELQSGLMMQQANKVYLVNHSRLISNVGRPGKETQLKRPFLEGIFTLSKNIQTCKQIKTY
jgi:hypothetical protein